MQASAFSPPSGPAAMPVWAAADLHGNLLAASRDLDRLQTLLGHACDELLRSFNGATQHVHAQTDRPDRDARTAQVLDEVTQHLTCAITALQFQDMASQLITHLTQRLRDCAHSVAHNSRVDAAPGAGAAQATAFQLGPVAQFEMDAGSVELF